MWTFENFPKAEVARKYGVEVTDEMLDRLQQAVVRLETGCTGSFVSPDGLVLTNHHCVSTCLADNSTAERDLLARGFTGKGREDEIRCQGSQASVLMESEDVTTTVASALRGVAGAEIARTRNETLTKIESACEAESGKTGTPLKCEAVTLYQGGEYWLYKYKRYDDVRLVFAPEAAIAAFGGDPDNFQFPRWCLDMSLLRAYASCMPGGGSVLITVPAFQCLWSGHDVFLEHRRRYSRTGLEAVVRAAGLQVVRSRYFFGLLLPIVATMRLRDGRRLAAGRTEAKTALKAYPASIGALLTLLHDVERVALVPFNRLAGLSVFCLARRA